MRNFNRSEFNNINSQPNWKCYLCHKAPLQGLRENYRKIRDTLKALQEKEKSKGVASAANPINEKEMLKPAEKTLMPSRRKQENSKIEDKSKTNGKPTTKSLLINLKVNGKDVSEGADDDDDSPEPSTQPAIKKRKVSSLDKDEDLEKQTKKDSKAVKPPVKRLKPGPKSSKKGMDYDDQSSSVKEKKESEDDDEDVPPVTFCLTPADLESHKNLNDDDDEICVTKNGALDNMESGQDVSDNPSEDEVSDADKKVKNKKSKKIKKKNTKVKNEDIKDGNTSKRKRRNKKLPDAKLSENESEIDEPKKKKEG